MPELSIILVTYNSSTVLNFCLGEISLDPNLQIIVVDNNSTDDTTSLLKSKFPNVVLIENPENVGFAKAVNQGSAYAKAEILLLLNPDASINLETLKKALATFDNLPDLGVLSPFTHEAQGSLDTVAAGHFPTLANMFKHSFGLYRLSGRFSFLRGHYLFKRSLPKGMLLDVDWVSGACLFVRRKVWLEVGGLSERWFMYAEDIDFCFEVKKRNWRICLDTSIQAKHLVGSSSGAEKNTSALWLLNLFDFYSIKISRSLVSQHTWRLIVSLGFYVRYVISFFSSKTNARYDRVRFLIYAQALSKRLPGSKE